MKRKLITWTAFAAIVGSILFFAFRPKPVEVEIGRVKSAPFAVTVDESGEARVRELYQISAPLAGRLERIQLEPGDFIEKDQILAEIVPVEPTLLDVRAEAEAMARFKAAEASFERAGNQFEGANAEAEKSRRYLERDQTRLKNGGISKPMLEDTEHALRIAEANLASAKSSVEVARFERDQAHAALLYSQSAGNQTAPEDRRFTIRSPIAGVVLRRLRESSTVVGAGESILELGDPGDLEVRIDVLSQDAVRIRPGQRILIEHWGGESDLTAVVRRVDPSAFTKVSALGVNEQRVWIHADFETTVPHAEGVAIEPSTDFPSPGGDPRGSGLGDAYRIEGRIVVYEREKAVQVPAGALFREGTNEKSSWAVYRIDPSDRAEKVIIDAGERNDLAVEVIAGLEEDDRVVLHPGDKVKDGVVVKERGE
jgi:HlyD family secretion protein